MRHRIDFKLVDKLIADLEADAKKCSDTKEQKDVLNVLSSYFALMLLVQQLPLRLRLIYWSMAYKTYLYLRLKKQLDDARQGFDKVVVTAFKAAVRRLQGRIDN